MEGYFIAKNELNELHIVCFDSVLYYVEKNKVTANSAILHIYVSDKVLEAVKPIYL